jgi:hypothetical protein
MESQEPTASVLKVGKIKPHQVALWFAIGFIVLSLLSPYLFGTFLFGRRFETYLSYLMWPGMWFSRYLGSSEGWNFIVMIIWGLFVVYIIFYIPIKLWMTSSRHLHIALVAYAALCFATYEFYQWYSTKPDWSSHGLNPDRPGFKPQVVVLAGKFDFWAHDSSVNLDKSGTAFFEIRMRGHNYYYCRKWHGNVWRPGSWFNVEVANHGEGFQFGLHCSSVGTGGGGGSWYGDHLVAQRLWNKQEFVGANKDDLIFKEAQWPKRKEEFSHLVKVGRWLIPAHIRLTQSGNDAREENYYIKKIEFLPTPDTNWFEQVFKKYSDLKSDLRTKDLDEPGVAPGKRK